MGSGKELESLDFKSIRGLDGIKEASITIGGSTINVCAASSLGNAKK